MDDLSYAQEIKSINEQKENNLTPDVEVGDVVELHNKCIIHNVANGETFNVGTGVPTTILKWDRH